MIVLVLLAAGAVSGQFMPIARSFSDETKVAHHRGMSPAQIKEHERMRVALVAAAEKIKQLEGELERHRQEAASRDAAVQQPPPEMQNAEAPPPPPSPASMGGEQASSGAGQGQSGGQYQQGGQQGSFQGGQQGAMQGGGVPLGAPWNMQPVPAYTMPNPWAVPAYAMPNPMHQKILQDQAFHQWMMQNRQNVMSQYANPAMQQQGFAAGGIQGGQGGQMTGGQGQTGGNAAGGQSGGYQAQKPPFSAPNIPPPKG